MPRKRKTPKRGSSQGQPSQQQGHGQPQQASLECQPQHGTEQILEQQSSNQQERHPQQASQGISYAQAQQSDSRRRKAPKEGSFQGQPSQQQGSERPQPASQEDQPQTLQCLQQGLRQEEGPGQPYQGQASVLPQIEQGEGSEPEGGHGRGRGRGLVEVKREIEDTRPASDLPIDSYSSFVPVRPSFPELPQAVQSSSPPFEQNVAGVETQAQSSVDILKPSLLPSAGGPSLEERLQMLSLQVPKHEVGSSSQGLPPPVSSKLMQFPLRPGKGQNGVKCIVKANHFFADLPDKDLHQYDVTIMPEVTSRAVNRVVMGQLVELYREIYLGGRLPVYDGRKSVYTAGPLPFISKDFTINLVDKDNETDHPRRERQFKVAIKFAAKADLHHLRQFLSGMQADAPQEALQVLDIVLRELPSQRYSPFGASFYSPTLGQRASLGGGLERWPGFYQSIRPTQMGLSLNIDMSSTAFIEPLPVIEFIVQLLNKNAGLQPLSDVDYVKIKKALRGVKIEVTHRGNMRRKYRISGLTLQPTQQLKFPLDNKSTMKSVVEYFQETYGYTIQYSQLPCLQAGNPQKPIYLPMEVCKIVEGQRYSKRLNEKQITALLRATCQRPQEREKSILQIVHHNAYDQDPYAKEFGIKISDELATVEARILPAPRLKYHDSGKESDCTPRVGQWNMMNKKLVNGGTVNYWACISFSRTVDEIAAHLFCQDLGHMCETSGMTFNKNPIIPILSGRPEQVESTLKRMQRDTKSKLREKQLELLIVILPENNGSLYGDVKRICETDLGIVSQCCLTKPVFRRNKQYLANVALKINVKVGGRNTVLVDALSRKISHVSDMPTIIFGADVTHPSPGEDLSPSIAAVVASQDWPEVTKYAVLVSAQPYRQELIQDLFKVVPDPKGAPAAGGMIRDLMISFRNATGQKPKRIIFYRDGVSESQFNQVLLHELEAIRKACRSLEKGYEPPVTFVVVQKRHHTRLFANNHRDRATVDTSGNILPGTVVDTKICHPTQFDFYLCSHAGIQGTSRPTHYHVIWDENNFTADDLQSLTNKLCYTYARCTRSVSIVPPAYYAHLAAFRARFYMERETSDSTSLPSEVAGKSMPVISGSRSSYLASGASVQPLPPIKENVKKVMFYC